MEEERVLNTDSNLFSCKNNDDDGGGGGNVLKYQTIWLVD